MGGAASPSGGAAGRLAAAFDPPAEGGPSLARALLTAVAVLFVVEAATGALLALYYVPSPTDAWASVFFVEQVVRGGWVVRGVHHHAAQAMFVVLGFHLVAVVVAGGYRGVGRVRWWATLGALLALLGALITGHRLPWDQNSYWALMVEVNIAAALPLVGEPARKLVLGGLDAGRLTLTRLYALHVVVVPLALWLLLARARAERPPAHHAPGQRARDALVLAAVGLAVLALTFLGDGAPLGGPAEPTRNHPARPEWFLLSLYALRALAPPALEIVAVAALPALALGWLAALPFVDRARPGAGPRPRLGVLAATASVGLGAVGLTVAALADAPTEEERGALAEADRRRDRAFLLARDGIPPGGPLEMLAHDPLTRGRDVYAQYCISCHVLDGEGEREAPDHTGFASEAWIVALLRDPDAPHFFGETGIDDMPSQAEKGERALRAAAAFLHGLGVSEGERSPDAALVAEGRALWTDKCMTCHVFEGDGDFLGLGGPDLTGYASLPWIVRQTATPEAHYGDLNEMPAFDDQLTDHDIRMAAEYLRLQRFAEPVFPEAP